MSSLDSIVRDMISKGYSSSEIVKALTDMGIDREEAIKLLILNSRELDKLIKDTSEEIARFVINEQLESVERNLMNDLKEYIDSRYRLLSRQITKHMREEFNKQLKEIYKVEEQVNLLEKKVLDLELRLYKDRPEKRSKVPLGKILSVIGVLLLISTLFLELDQFVKTMLAVVGMLLVLGGVMLG